MKGIMADDRFFTITPLLACFDQAKGRFERIFLAEDEVLFFSGKLQHASPLRIRFHKKVVIMVPDTAPLLAGLFQ